MPKRQRPIKASVDGSGVALTFVVIGVCVPVKFPSPEKVRPVMNAVTLRHLAHVGRASEYTTTDVPTQYRKR